MSKLKVITLCALLALPMAEAAPPSKPDRYYTQSNGEKVLLKRAGNAQMHWLETRKGHIVVFNQTSKNYEYAALELRDDQARLVPSGITVGEAQQRADFSPLLRKDLPRLQTTLPSNSTIKKSQ